MMYQTFTSDSWYMGNENTFGTSRWQQLHHQTNSDLLVLLQTVCENIASTLVPLRRAQLSPLFHFC